MLKRTGFLGVLPMLLVVSATALSADWPYWRGPNRNNISTETGWRTDWKARPPTLLWQANVGYRHGAPVIAEGRVFVHGDDYTDAKNGNQILYALDAATGKELWKDVSPVLAFNTQPITYSPAVDGGKVYFYTASATLKCLGAADGKVIWSQDLTSALGVDRAFNYGIRCSPVIWEDKVVVTIRVVKPGPQTDNKKPSLAAFDKLTGKLIWLSNQPSVRQERPSNRDYGSNWHTPTPAEIHGVPTLVFNTGFSCAGINLKDGRNLWEFMVPEKDLGAEPGVAAISPIVTGDMVVFTYWNAHVSGHTYGIRIKPDNTVEQLWMSDDLTGWKFSCLTESGGAVFGVNQRGVHAFGPFVCVDLKTGKLNWSVGPTRKGTAKTEFGCGFTVADGKLLIWDGKRVHLAEARTDKYEELGVSADLPATEVTPGQNHNAVARSGEMIPPILSNGRIYCRSAAGELFCVDVR